MTQSPSKFEIVRREMLYQGFFRAERLTLRHELFHGGFGGEIRREVMIKPRAAGVLPYDPATDQVLLIEQFRVGAIEEPHGAWLLEIVAGYIEEGETGEEMVRRESQEEAGLTVGLVEHALDFLLSPASCNERFSLFLAQADLSRAGGVHGLASEGEDIRVNVMSLDQAWQATLSGRVNNAPALIALQWLMLHRDRIRSRWLV